jgi:putative protease
VIIPIDSNAEKLPPNVNFALELPRGISNENYVLKRLEIFKSKGINVAFCSTLAAAELAKTAGMKIVSSFGFNIYNSYSAEFHKTQGALGVVLSPELLLSDAKHIDAHIPKGLITYGRLPLMLTRNCPVKNKFTCTECGREQGLTDRKETYFPVRCQNGYSELLNSKVLWLADRKAEYSFINFEILYFTDETPDRVDRVISAYEQGASPDCDFTRGLYYRGVE